MKRVLGGLFWLAVWVLVIAGLCIIFYPLHPDDAALRAVAETRQALRAQGFKTDLADFNFSTTSEQHAREAILHNTIGPPGPRPIIYYPNLQQPIGNNSAMVVWKLESLEPVLQVSGNDNTEVSWNGFRAVINQNQKEVDAVCAAFMSGSVRWTLDARQGAGLRLPHLAVMKNVTQTLCSRAVIALHDGDKNAAWTNLMAATRLVSAWEPEPAEVSHLVRFADTALTFGALWQALQTNGWPDEKLLRLQQEWESVNFFTNLPEVVAFDRASTAAAFQQSRKEWRSGPFTPGEFINAWLHSPIGVWQELERSYSQRDYANRGIYVDEKNALLSYRDREVEMRRAFQAPTWLEMRQLPAVTNEMFFHSPFPGRRPLPTGTRRMIPRLQSEDATLLGRAAKIEVYRQLMITAIALERYRGKHGSYPQNLAELVPEFLKAVPADFMDGQPLHYRLADDGHFLLYSVGLDCVDDGGKAVVPLRPNPAGIPREARGDTPKGDIVWPLPAGPAAMQEEQQIQAEAKKAEAKAKEVEQKHYLAEISDREWQQSPGRQPRVAKILAMNRAVGHEEPMFKGQSAGNLIRNAQVLGTNQLSLDALLTPRQIITGKEPEDITFELPISYDSFITNNIVFPIVDADPEEELPFDCGGKVYDRERATNGDCMLVWHAIYDPPGPHAVQVYLALQDKREGTLSGIGPPIAVTTSNLCQFSLDSANYDVDRGATFHARLPEAHGLYTIDCVTTNGEHLKTLTGSTTNGEFKTIWNLVDDHGQRLHGETFNSIVHITLPDSGRTQTLRGP